MQGPGESIIDFGLSYYTENCNNIPKSTNYNTDTINILVWYFSISNNIFNILIEMLNAYDLTTEKMRIKLLIREGILFISNHRDYNYYPVEVDNNEKLQYFSRACNEIINNYIIINLVIILLEFQSSI